MRMLEVKINFAQIQSRVDAARSLQDSGCDDDSKYTLRKLAKDILEKVKQTKQE